MSNSSLIKVVPPVREKSKTRAVKRQGTRAPFWAHNKAIIKSAWDIAKSTKAQAIFLYVDAFDTALVPEHLPKDCRLVLVTKQESATYNGRAPYDHVVTLPAIKLGRLGLIKIAIILGISTKVVSEQDKIVFVAGKSAPQRLDHIFFFDIATENEVITQTGTKDIPEHIRPAVFEHVLNLAVELAHKGREGKPIGTIFVLGDEDKVLQLSKQMIMNPFRGYADNERNLLDHGLTDTIREFSALDGAFVISGDGEVLAAGRYLGAAANDSDIPRGLGSRHLAAAGITALTNAIAIVISESTGAVRIFRNGQVLMEIEKPASK